MYVISGGVYAREYKRRNENDVGGGYVRPHSLVTLRFFYVMTVVKSRMISSR